MFSDILGYKALYNKISSIPFIIDTLYILIYASKTCDSAIQLREKGQVVLRDVPLKHLGSVHLEKGVVDSHFEVNYPNCIYAIMGN